MDSDSSGNSNHTEERRDSSSNSNRTAERGDSSSNSSSSSNSNHTGKRRRSSSNNSNSSSNSNRRTAKRGGSSSNSSSSNSNRRTAKHGGSSSSSNSNRRTAKRRGSSSNSSSNRRTAKPHRGICCNHWLWDSCEQDASDESDDSERDFEWRRTSGTSSSVGAASLQSSSPLSPPPPSATRRHEILVWPPSSIEQDLPEFMRWAFHTPVTAPTAISSDISGDSDNEDDDYRASSNASAFRRDPRFLPRRLRRIRRLGSTIHFADEDDLHVLYSRITRRITRNSGYLSFSQIKPRSEFIQRFEAPTLLQFLGVVPDDSIRRHKRSLTVLLYNILVAHGGSHLVDLICNKTGRLWMMIGSRYFYSIFVKGLMKLEHARGDISYGLANSLDVSVQCILILLQRISVDWNKEYFENHVDAGDFRRWFASAMSDQHYVRAVFFSLFVKKRMVSKVSRKGTKCRFFQLMTRQSRNALLFMLLIRDLPLPLGSVDLRLNSAIRAFIEKIFSSTLATRAVGVQVREYGISWTLQRLRAHQYPREVKEAVHCYMFQLTWFFVSTYLSKCECCVNEPGYIKCSDALVPRPVYEFARKCECSCFFERSRMEFSAKGAAATASVATYQPVGRRE